MSKHGLIGLTRTLAAEWGGRGVRSNAVCPGWVKTEMDATDQARGHYSDGDITGRIPMGRFASPDDVASAVAFLADPQQSGFINGAALTVDGGWSSDGGWQSLRDQHRLRSVAAKKFLRKRLNQPTVEGPPWSALDRINGDERGPKGPPPRGRCRRDPSVVEAGL